MKAFIITTVIMAVIIIGLIAGVIITAQAGRIINFTLADQVQDLRADIAAYKIKVKMRDDILSDIKLHAGFKKIDKVTIDIDRWEQLKETEKAKNLTAE